MCFYQDLSKGKTFLRCKNCLGQEQECEYLLGIEICVPASFDEKTEKIL